MVYVFFFFFIFKLTICILFQVLWADFLLRSKKQWDFIALYLSLSVLITIKTDKLLFFFCSGMEMGAKPYRHIMLLCCTAYIFFLMEML